MLRFARIAVVLLALAGVGVLATGCSSDSEATASSSAGSVVADGVVRMWIAPELADCVGVAPMQCMQVAYEEGGPTQLFYDSIEGFDYVEGMSYVLDVQVSDVEDPPADASSKRYTLVEVVSQTPA